MSRVFVPQEPTRLGEGGRLERTIDISPAGEFGRLVFAMPPGAPPTDPDASLPFLAKVFADFTEQDYLLPVGPPQLIAWSAIYAARASGGRLSLLVWRKGRYIPVCADLSPELENLRD